MQLFNCKIELIVHVKEEKHFLLFFLRIIYSGKEREDTYVYNTFTWLHIHGSS